MRSFVALLCIAGALPLGMDALAAAPMAAEAPASETSDLSLESLESILARLERLEGENADLRSRLDEVAGTAPSSESGDAFATPAAVAPPDNVIHDDEVTPTALDRSWGRRNGRSRHSGGDYPTLGWGGFIQLDSGWVSQDAANKAAVGDVAAQTGLRRVRLRAGGRVRPDISYVVDLDFAASGHPSFRDIKFTIHDRPLVHDLAIGYFQQPFGLDATSSGRDLVLMERQLPFAFAPFRQTGVRSAGTALDSRVAWAHAGYRFPTDSFGVSEGDRGGWAYAGRATAICWEAPEAGALVHVGGSYSFQDPGNDIVRYAIEPGFFVSDPTGAASNGDVPVFVDTGEIATENVNLFDAELVGLWGPWSLQAEAVRSVVNPDAGPQLGFGGASAKLGYVLTGESHDYRRNRGVVGGVTPAEETTSFFDPLSGAWEATAGWAWIDLDDESVQGGEMQTIIIGLNRYMNTFTKLQLNVIRTLLDEPATGQSAATVVALRAQAEF